jgi:curved DNA-binding protein CbpA
MRRSLLRLNHYQTLGVGFRAAPSEIKLSFRELAKKYHPDQNPGDEKAERRFREVKEAYECLSSKLKRAEYDRDFVKSGRVRWVQKTDHSADANTGETGFSRAKLLMLYAGTIGLPFLASLIRSSEDPYESKGTALPRSGWTHDPPIPVASPRDELTRAFYNPYTRQWERLGDHYDPPSPLELLRFVIKEQRGAYKDSLKLGASSIPSADDVFEVYKVPDRVTVEPILAVDIESRARVPRNIN